MRLRSGMPAPPFTVPGIDGEPVTLEQFADRRLWLVLSRFAACPWCSLRVDMLIRRHPEIVAAGVDLLVLFPSPAERIERYVMRYKPPFRVGADPDETVFRAYGSERSLAAVVRTVVDVPRTVRALVNSGGPPPPSHIDGPADRLPCEFLIDGDGRLARVHYGATLDDGFDVEEVLAWGQSWT